MLHKVECVFSAGRPFSLEGGIRESGELGMGGGRDDVGGKGGGVFKMGKSLCIFKRINSATGE